MLPEDSPSQVQLSEKNVPGDSKPSRRQRRTSIDLYHSHRARPMARSSFLIDQILPKSTGNPLYFYLSFIARSAGSVLSRIIRPTDEKIREVADNGRDPSDCSGRTQTSAQVAGPDQ
jgi:hypothetical protein